MIDKGDIIRGKIIDFTHEGNGVLKTDNLIVFVTGCLIGDYVEVSIDEIKRNFALGSLVEILEPSENRTKLDFNLEESLGGIPLIEYEYSKQLEWKREKVRLDLMKIGGLEDVLVHPTIGMEDPFGYRNHVQIPVGEENGETVLGFYEPASNKIVDMERTILLPEVGNRIFQLIRKWIKEYKIRPYNRKTKKGILRHIGIRINKDSEVMLIIVTGSSELPYKEELIEILSGERVVSIYQNINKSNSSITYGREYIKIHGEDKLVDYIDDYKFYLSPKSFFQVNRGQAEVLYNKAMEYLEPNKNDKIYDLYCGIGTISLYIASKAGKVYGIEVVEEAIEDARENARINDIDNAEFVVGKAEEIFPKLMEKGIKGNKVVLDPPRKGCEKEVLESIIGLMPEKIVYVSCSPSTMARDVKYLVENGYEVKEVQPVDMFPHTGHVEAAILMTYCGLEDK